MRQRKKHNWSIFWLLAAITIVIDLPIVLMIINSFKPTAEILTSKSILPEHFTFDNYKYLNKQSDFWLFFKNSAIVAISGTAAGIVIASFAGYALSRFSNRFTRVYGKSLLMLQMFPVILVIIPLFIMFRKMGLVNTYSSVIILYTTAFLPFSIWMFKGFFDSIPKDLEEAASIDGCSHFQCFVRVILPISGPGIAAVAIFCFLSSWNEFLIAQIFLRKNDLFTIPVGIQMFVQQYSSDWGVLMAAATLSMMPVLLFALFAQKYMVQGIGAGAVKG